MIKERLKLSPVWLALLSIVTMLASQQGLTVAAEAETQQIVFSEVEIPSLPSLENADRYLSVEEDIHLVIKLSKRRVYVYQGDRAVTSYPIAIGRRGWETPAGNFQVLHKVQNPSWKHPLTGKIMPPGPDNPLGDRWIGFWTDGKNYIGFHGTPTEHLIGQAVSHGCVRMRNQDVRSLFEQVETGTPVIVQP